MRAGLGISPAYCPTPLVAWTPLSLAPFAWYRGDAVSLVSGAVDVMSDLSGNARHLSAPTPAQRPAWNANELLCGNQPTVEATATTHGLKSALAASEWNFISDNTGASILMVIRRAPVSSTGYVLSTQGASSSNIGTAYYDFGNGTQRIQIGDGVTTGTATVPAGGAPTGRALYCEGNYSGGLITLRAGLTTIATGSGPATPATPAAQTLHLFNYSALNAAFRGAIAELVILNRVISSEERLAWIQYATGRYFPQP